MRTFNGLKPNRWVVGDRVMWEVDGKVVHEGAWRPKPLSPTAQGILELIQQKGRVCSLELTKGQRICAMACLVHRGLVRLFPSPEGSAPGKAVYYLELPSVKPDTMVPRDTANRPHWYYNTPGKYALAELHARPAEPEPEYQDGELDDPPVKVKTGLV